jgi:hypothetical protein
MEMARFEVGHKKLAGAGRKRGTRNRITSNAKQIIEEVAVRLGSADGLHRWALASQINMRAFWTVVFPRLLPLQVHGQFEIEHKTLTGDELAAQLLAHGLPPTLFGAEVPGLAEEQTNTSEGHDATEATKH